MATSTVTPSDKRMYAEAAMRPNSKSFTPSWTSIVEAYHKDGGGDREMLLALLHAKAKEDERLAALDLLKAEQMRAYSTHLAVHGPLYPQMMAGPGHALPCSSIPSTSTLTSASASETATSVRSAPSASNSDRSRAPSLSNSVSSRTSSSPAELPVTSEAEERVVMAGKQHNPYAASPPLKRKRSSIGEDDNVVAVEVIRKRSSPIVGSRRNSPTSFSPGPASLMAPLSPSSSSHSKTISCSQATLQHILNTELRPLLSSTRVLTSDVRSSSSSGDEE